MNPIGVIRCQNDAVWIDLIPDFKQGLLGLEAFSHIMVLFWLHQNDTAQRRGTLQVHPMKDPQKPLTGVFATHAPMRPNLIAVTVCKLVSIEGCRLFLETIDALDGSPVLDIKCYIPHNPVEAEVKVPTWVPTQG